MSTVFQRGVLSYSKVRALTRVATPDNEASLIAFAMTTTATRVEERCQQMRNALPDSTQEAERIHGQRNLRVLRDRQRGVLMLTVELPMEQGELVCRALDKAVEDHAGNGPEHEPTSWHTQQADALVDVASSYLTGASSSPTSSAETYQVVVHVNRSALIPGAGRSDLPIEAVRRLTCDAGIVPITDGPDGEPLSVGRRQRVIPTAIRRAL
jgi:hypothetical protein